MSRTRDGPPPAVDRAPAARRRTSGVPVSPGATFERVYRALKAELGRGRFRPGDPLEPAVLSGELNASITPVRDALHRLVGEGLVEAPRGDGFRAPLMTEVALRHLYGWNQWLLTGALREGGGLRAVISVPDVELEHEAPIEPLFARIACLSSNPEHVLAVLGASDRLRGVRQVEPDIVGDTRTEAEEMEASLDDRRALRKQLALYHRRRLRAAPDIVAALHAGRP